MKRIALISLVAVFIVSSCAWFTGTKPAPEVQPVPDTEMAPEVRIKAENFVTDGVNHFQNQRYAEAIAAWQNAIELIPGDAEVHNFMGIAYHKMTEFDKAITHFKMASDLDSTYFEAFNNLGFMLFLKGDYNNAINAFNKALVINPEYDQAMLNYNKTKKVMTGELLRDVFELTEKAEKLDDVDEKIIYYHKILAIDSNYVEGHNNIGVAYYYADNLDSAYYHLNKAISLRGEYPEALNNLGYIYKTAGRYEDAITLFMKAISLKKRYTIALNNLGETYLAMNENDNARRVFQTVIDVEPNNQYALDNLNQIKQGSGTEK